MNDKVHNAENKGYLAVKYANSTHVRAIPADVLMVHEKANNPESEFKNKPYRLNNLPLRAIRFAQ